MPVSLTPARHRTAGRPTTAFHDLAAAAVGGLAPAGRRAAVVVASSGLIVSMLAAPASAAQAVKSGGLPAVDISGLTSSARAMLNISPGVTVPASATWNLDMPVVTIVPQGATCSSGTTIAAVGPVLPASIGSFSGAQISNAAQVVLAARDLGLDAHGQAIAVMTAIGESTLNNVNFGDKAGPDSRGLFQQRANGAWGTYAQRMDPRTAATSFLKVLLQVPGWQTMAPTLAAHAVQRNADPNHYTRFWADAVLIVATLGGDANLASTVSTSLPPC